ncbi:hypothetical protein TWF694_005891 [Orbilia ellipsospora]|uniref:NACHT domain-containing protein n=1 Tax=Orbilia ellipsospora TaxID=2528407 RepID=A0AAV9WSA2_9PEZI
MEVVGGVSSVIAIVDLTAKVAKICAQYINGVKHAPEEIKTFKEKIEHLGGLLEDLDKLLKGPDSNRFISSKKLCDTLKDCRYELENLELRIEIPGTPTAITAIAQPSNSSTQSSHMGLGTRIRKRIEKAVKIKDKITPELVQILRWPMTKPEVETILSRINGIQDVLNTAMLVDQSTIMLEIIRKINLNLPVADGAHYGWYDGKDEYEPLCLPNTREDILTKIKDWAISSTSKHMFWLSGPAGSGKSTVARTVAHNFQHENKKGGDWSRLPDAPFLGGSFFFRRGEKHRSNCSRFFTSLAVNLAQLHHDQHLPGISTSISQTIDKESDISREILTNQFEGLILQSLLSIKPLKRVLLVIDALDECENENEVNVIIRLLWQLKDIPNQPVRVLFTGRPENFVDRGFENRDVDGFYRKEYLHEIPEGNIHNDIYIYVQNEFNKIKEGHRRAGTLPADWPDDADVRKLVQMAVPLFIVAATICKFLGDEDLDPKAQLVRIMNRKPLLLVRSKRSLRETYNQILAGRLDDKTDEGKTEFLAEFRDIVGTIVLLETPLSCPSLSPLIEKPMDDIHFRLQGFHSVIHVPKEISAPVRIFHLTFREFLFDIETKERDRSPFWLDEAQVHKNIAIWCINLMKKELKEKNICQLKSLGTLKKDIPYDIIQTYLPPELRYAVGYWVHHLVKSGERLKNNDDAHLFLQENILGWLEATCLLNISYDDIYKVIDLQSILSTEGSEQVADLLSDLRRFILFNHEVIATMPLQIYSSALLFSPKNSLIRQRFYQKHLDWVLMPPNVPDDWNGCIQTIEATETPECLIYSPNGRYIAGRTRQNIYIFDSTSGDVKCNCKISTAEDKGKFHGTSHLSLAFSSDSAHLAATSREGVFVLDIATGFMEQRIHTSEHFATQIIFSPNDEYLISGHDDGTLCIWCTTTWRLVKTLTEHKKFILTLSFSPDGSLLVSGGYESGTKLWDARTWDLLQVFGAGFTKSAKFSPEGERLVCCEDWSLEYCFTSEPNIKIYQVKSKRMEQVLTSNNHSSDEPYMIPEIAEFISKDLLVVMDESRIILWNLASMTFRQIDQEPDNDAFVGLAVSLDRRFLAYTGPRTGAKIWDLTILERSNYSSFDRIVGYQPDISWIDVSADCQLLAIGHEEFEEPVELWRLTTEGPVFFHNLDGQRGDCRSEYGKLSPSNKLLASRFSSKITIWDTMSTEVLLRYKHPQNLFLGKATFSPDGTFLAVFTVYHSSILILDMNAIPPKFATEIVSYVEKLTYGDFSTDGKVLILAGINKYRTPHESLVVELWNTKDWKLIKTTTIVSEYELLSVLEQGVEIDDYQMSISPRDISEGMLDEIGAEGWRKLLPAKLEYEYYGKDTRGWIRQDGENVLWIPHEFRPKFPEAVSIRRNMVAIGNFNHKIAMRLGRVR